MNWRALVVFTLCAAMAGCPVLRSPPSQEFLKAESLVQALAQQASHLRSMRAEAIVQVKKSGKRMKMRARLAAARPANFRLEMEDIFGQAISLFVSDGMKYCYWEAQQSSWRTGPAVPREVEQVALLPLDGVELARVFLGEVPLILWVKEKVIREKRGRHWWIEIANPRQRQLLQIGTQPLVVERVLLYESDKLIYQTWLEWEKREELVIPKNVFFDLPYADLQVEVKLREIETNGTFDDSLFAFPAGCVEEP